MEFSQTAKNKTKEYFSIYATHLLKQFLVNTKVALVTDSASTRPAGTINNSPSGLNVKRLKNERIVSSWNIRNNLGFTESLLESLLLLFSVLVDWVGGRTIFFTFATQFLPLML